MNNKSLTSRQELHDEVEVDGVLEGVEHLHYPRVVGLHEDVALGAHVRDLLALDHVCLAQDLHRVDVARVDLLDQSDLELEEGKGTLFEWNLFAGYTSVTLIFKQAMVFQF